MKLSVKRRNPSILDRLTPAVRICTLWMGLPHHH
ncbi:hypothetical protein NK6_2212 [Bradyrhizobium diazoefficiens]|uniref:Uncharacterized protein n=1 Tax=Bradyrhizobium diazoefficiens TaxID=1355477 RepID=A0A0E4FS61_9BRAD|nr:hypothetical protein NK6_2212 [Bradyrhizobium diazoefficiens]